MNFPADQWIWLDPAVEPQYQTARYNGFLPGTETYAVAVFQRKYEFNQPIRTVQLRFSGDTEFRLLCNGKLVATGPVTVAGDFMKNETVRPWHYATEVCMEPDGCELFFEARVKLTPVGINEYSKGHGGWMLSGIVCLADGTTEIISTDQSWSAHRDPRYTAIDHFDASVPVPVFHHAAVLPDIWHAQTAPLHQRSEEKIEERSFEAAPASQSEYDFEFPAIYAGFVTVTVRTKGKLTLKIRCMETENDSGEEFFVFDRDTDYIGLQLRSIGRYQVSAINSGAYPAFVTVSVTVTHYPVAEHACTKTSDPELNAVLHQCEHALKHCRQMIHLDSPLHSEPLACTGDYYIETLMTAFSFGDLSLAAFDVFRTAEMLRYQKGIMFHTTYSLIWVLMLYDVYLYTGNLQLLTDCADALETLLERFHSYLGETGLIENPPSFMFIDWLYIDGISLHHPPKALGQSCLNMFYHAALKKAELIWKAIGRKTEAERCRREAEKLRRAINTLLYDREKELYFEGLSTPTPENLLGQYMPQNTEKRYYRIHANVLAVYSGVYEGNAAVFLESVLSNAALGEYQPYFAHFVLEAVYRTGLHVSKLLTLIEPWKQAWRKCPKGLQEGFIKPEPTYSFDHSHAWGGTPLYAVPLALSGLEILEPGMSRISLQPELCGLQWANIEIPSPYGMIRLFLKEGKDPEIIVPDGIGLAAK